MSNNRKRIFFETEETVQKTKRGYIDLEMDFFQIYSNAFHHLASLTNIAAKDFILWIMGKVDDQNEFHYSQSLYDDFMESLSKIAKPKTYAKNTLHVSIKELVDNKILIKIAKAHYKVNPRLFWSEDANKRVEAVKILESNERIIGSSNGVSINDEFNEPYRP